MHGLVRLPYGAVGRLAEWIALATPSGGGKLRRSIAARAGVTDRFRAWSKAHRSPSAPLIWFHAPSVGEGRMAQPVIDRIRDARPDVQLAYTFFSPSAERFAASLGVDIADYLPFDTADAADAMLAALRPAVIAFSKLDVWPTLAEAAAARRIPLVLTSATLAPQSRRASTLARLALADAYAALTAVGAVSEDDAARLVALGVRRERVTVTGDARYDQSWARAATSATQPIVRRLRSDRPTVVAGSTWRADEACIGDAWPAVRAAVPSARLIIAPHEPTTEAVTTIRARAEAAGLSVATIPDATPAHDVVIVDVVGPLAHLYSLAQVAYVGGGFHAAGLHSVVEPAASGAPVVVGPRHADSRDATALLGAGGAIAVSAGADLAAAIIGWLRDPETQTRAARRARQVIEAGLGAADRSAALILPLLKPLRPSR